jgi:hypothetical protein
MNMEVKTMTHTEVNKTKGTENENITNTHKQALHMPDINPTLGKFILSCVLMHIDLRVYFYISYFNNAVIVKHSELGFFFWKERYKNVIYCYYYYYRSWRMLAVHGTDSSTSLMYWKCDTQNSRLVKNKKKGGWDEEVGVVGFRGGGRQQRQARTILHH